jgi:O-antigen/teichoic acid export membrane protein
MVASVTGALLNLVTNYIFIKIYSYYAAGYTTLFCYLVYAAGHYLMMNRVCDRFLGGIRPFPAAQYWGLSIAFMSAGFVLLFTYQSRIMRYGLLFLLMVLALIFRRRLKAIAKSLVNVRKEGKKK